MRRFPFVLAATLISVSGRSFAQTATPAPTLPPGAEEFPLVPAHEPETFGGAAASPAAAPVPASGGSISGKITIAPELASKVGANDILYVIARPAAGGPPLALKRISPISFPASFTLTSADNPMGGGAGLSGKLMIKARVDKDGDAMSTTAGDLEGILKETDAGATDASVIIDHEIEGE
ncbi:MAG: hypothetical protein U0166_24305 [Acidobacteriota bacterium]